MSTDPFQLYLVIAQIAATFAGFGSLASGLGQAHADDARVDASRLALMLFASLSATLLGLLPGTLGGIGLGATQAVQVSAAAAVVAMIAYAPFAARRSSRIWHVGGYTMAATAANGVCVVISLAAFGLCAAGAARGQVAGLYLVGLLGLLASSVLTFSRVIASMLRRHTYVDNGDGRGGKRG